MEAKEVEQKVWEMVDRKRAGIVMLKFLNEIKVRLS